jgi:ribose 5-phosphate isomerase B
MIDQSAKQLVVAVASDHGGFELKSFVVGLLKNWNHRVIDLGVESKTSVDYPEYAAKLAQGIASKEFDLGVLVCGTGIGMSMTANRFRGVRAALCHSGYTARMARAHNKSNVLCLGERVLGFGEAEDILRTFLEQEFEGDRHQRRIDKIDSFVSNG